MGDAIKPPKQNQPSGKPSFYCTACNFPLKGDEKFCPTCGVYLIKEGQKIKCKICGAGLAGNFCAKCGAPAVVDEKDVHGGSILDKTFKMIAETVGDALKYVLKTLQKIFKK